MLTRFLKPPTLPSPGERGFGRCRDEAFAAGSSAGWDLFFGAGCFVSFQYSTGVLFGFPAALCQELNPGS